MLTQCYRWIKGYLKIRLIGYSPERFINICKNKNIIVWDIKSFQNSYELYILMSDFKKLKPLCKKTVTKVKILEKRGFPFHAHRFKKRKSFLIGISIFLILIYISSLHIWTINISGNKMITSDIICSYLKEQSIKIGTSANKINCKDLAADLRKNYEDIIWVSVSLDGTSLIIELRENTDSKSIVDSDPSPTDLVASFDGIITNIITRNGIPLVKVGDSVKKGDILVSGCIPVMNDNKEIISTKYVKADADIWGEIRVNYHDQIDSIYQKKNYLSEFIYLEVGPLKTPLKSKKNLEVFVDHNLIKIGKIHKYKIINKQYTTEECESILKNRYQKYIDSLISDNIIINDSHFLITHKNNLSIAVSNLLLEQPIEESRKIIDLSSENMLQ